MSSVLICAPTTTPLAALATTLAEMSALFPTAQMPGTAAAPFSSAGMGEPMPVEWSTMVPPSCSKTSPFAWKQDPTARASTVFSEGPESAPALLQRNVTPVPSSRDVTPVPASARSTASTAAST
ncbi:hypothetical protein [Brevibacterium antiquum]|uniref:hypothetical protein n=1 Tax=Brevibacterium antiquum TaxID=234835 RepID=UPI0011AF38A8|nr:hypothetical protein [Brevibacterium antiquum]